MEELDIASLAGLLLGVVMFLFGVFSSGGASGLFNMFDFPSIIITLGGSISGTLASNKLQDFIAGLKSITLTFKEVPQDPAAVIRNIIDLSNTARKEGLLALEEAANGIEDEFLKRNHACGRWYRSGTGKRYHGDGSGLYRAATQKVNRCMGKMGRTWSCLGYDRYPDRIDPDAQGYE